MKRSSSLSLLVLVLVAAACGTAADPPLAEAEEGVALPPGAPAVPTAPAPDRGTVVARVNGAAIYAVDLESAMTNFMQSSGMPQDIPAEQRGEVRQEVLDGLIGSELLFQKAKSIPIEVPQSRVDETLEQTRSGMGPDAFQAELDRRGLTVEGLGELVRQNLMVQKMIQEVVLGGLIVPEAEIRKFYQENQEKMTVPPGADVRHIIVRSAASDPEEKREQARAKIAEALQKVKAGTDFDQVAKDFSEDASAAQGGSLGTVQRGQTPPAFEQAAFSLPIGEVSGIVETPFGFHLLKVTGRREAGVASLEEAKAQIAEFLKQRKSQETIETMVEALRAEAKIEIL